MKSKIAKRPKYLIEVFHSTLEYGKDQRSYESRKGLIDWKDEKFPSDCLIWRTEG